MTVDGRILARDLGSVCGNWRELDPETDAHLSVDGKLPPLWCEPSTPEELAAVLKLAGDAGAAVIPRGGGTRLQVGAPPRAADLLLSTRGLQQIIEYEPADLTVTVQAGMVLGELQARLNAEGQFLALDPPSAAGATIGGVVASNASGPLRLAYGSARDLVIGCRVASPDGVLTKAGGRVVKNVAGYDLNKLYTGSFGTLGVIVELSFKLHPLPQRLGTVVAVFDDLDAADAVVKRVMRSPLNPSALEVLSPSAGAAVGLDTAIPAGGCALVSLVGGFEKAVERVTREIAEYGRERGRAEIRGDDEPTGRLWGQIRALTDASDPQQPVVKIAVPPARSLEVVRTLESAAASQGLQVSVLAHAGVGLVYGRFERRAWDEAALDRLAALVREVRQAAREREGSLVVESCPLALKSAVDVWGEIGPSLRLMRALKEQLDPGHVLNPGRFVGGI